MEKIDIIIPLLSLFGGAIAYFLDRFVITKIEKKEKEKLEWYKTKLEKVLTPLFLLLSELLHGKNMEKTKNEIKSILKNYGYLVDDEFYDDVDEFVRIELDSSPQYVWNILIAMEYIIDQTEKIREILYTYPLEIERETLLKAKEKLIFRVGKRIVEFGKYILLLIFTLLGAYTIISLFTMQLTIWKIALIFFVFFILILYIWTHIKVMRIKKKISKSTLYEQFKSNFKKRWLQVGDRGKDVIILQKILFNLGYSIGSQLPDGILGPETAKSVIAFQESVGLTPDGIVGPNTRDELCKAYLRRLRSNGEIATKNWTDSTVNT